MGISSSKPNTFLVPFLALVLACILAGGCGPAPTADQAAATLAPPSPTQLPPNDPPPTLTVVPSSSATASPTNTPTSTPKPTATPKPTPTPTARPLSVPTFEPDYCRFYPAVGYEKECGYLVVPEDRSQPGGRLIRIHVVIFKSTSPNPAPDPVIYIAGGAGTNQLDSHEYYLTHGGDEILKTRDYIMFNQRGGQYNEPSLHCRGEADQLWSFARQNLSREETQAQHIAFLLECHDRFVEQGINLSAYNTAETAADINDLRIALGYDQVNLYGTSSGSRTALSVMHYHPEGVRSAILDSVFPPQATIDEDTAPNVYRAFKAVFDACLSDPYCRENYPDLERTFFQAASDLNADPVELEFDRGSASIDGFDFIRGLTMHLYSAASIPKLPKWIYQASNRDLSNLKYAIASIKFEEFSGNGVIHSLLCHEEIPFESHERSLALAADLPPLLREAWVTPFQFNLCESWQSGQADPIENSAITSDIPALVLAGEFDPVTPPAWSRLAAETLSNSFFYEFPGLAHGIMRADACGLEIGLQFLDDPLTEPDSSCIADLPGVVFE